MGFVATAFLAMVAATALAGVMPWWVLGVYLAASIATYVAYARDKVAAGRGAWRTAETTLLLLSFVGGWPGALFAQYNLRHKNRKLSFQLQFWLAVALNLGLLAWLRTL
jgi:uncharacterized membrane protein YsdA (DUF1294 family)